MVLRPSGGGAATAPPDEPKQEVIATTAAARVAIAELEKRGRLTATQVVNAARDPASPLHEYFEWDNTAAADAWRIEQARRLIRSVRVVVTYESQTLATPRYVRDTARDDDEQGYVTMLQLEREPKNAAALLRYEFKRAASIVERSLNIAEALGVKSDAQKVLDGIKRALAKIA